MGYKVGCMYMFLLYNLSSLLLQLNSTFTTLKKNPSEKNFSTYKQIIKSVF